MESSAGLNATAMSQGLALRAPVLLAHSYYLRYDPKQVRKMKPYAPLSTLITASVVRHAGLPLGFFDSMNARASSVVGSVPTASR